MEVADESDMKVWTDVGVLHDEGERVVWRGDGGEQNLRRVSPTPCIDSHAALTYNR